MASLKKQGALEMFSTSLNVIVATKSFTNYTCLTGIVFNYKRTINKWFSTGFALGLKFDIAHQMVTQSRNNMF